MKSPAEDLDRRRPVWEAMSEFFLDTELEAEDFERIAGVLQESGYSDTELEHILWRELSPVLGYNLGPAPGEWDGFDQELLEERILAGPPGLVRRWESYLCGGRLARHDWEKVKAILGMRGIG
jgi:hypothetical protein